MFEDSKLKLERANKHIFDLNNILSGFLETDFYRIGIDHDTESRTNKLIFEVTKLVPIDAAMAIGDAVHNMRTALDIMAVNMVKKCGGTPNDWTRFPFFSSRDKLVNGINGGEMQHLGPTIISFLVDTIKPYTGGNAALCDLHRLDIMDKHQSIIPTACATTIFDVKASDDRRNTFDFRRVTVGEGGKLNLVQTGSDLKVTSYGKLTIDIRFVRNQPFENQSVVPALHGLSQLVSSTVQAFEKALLDAGII
ncbi:MAG: hypothetical protein P4L91_14580 [Burkholderiaceae bacterium]|nr:hypothetical protein [Burkholderiaceae bacterium]